MSNAERKTIDDLRATLFATLEGVQPQAIRELNDVLTQLLSGSDRMKKSAIGGVQMTASSGTPGSDATSGQARWPSTSACRAFTSQTGPLKPPSLRFRSSTEPKLPSRSDAPMSATEAG